MTVTRRELDQPPVQTVFEIKDHSASSAWEKFSSQIRNVVEEWNLEERKPNTDSGAIIKNEHLIGTYPIGRRYKRTPVAYFPPHILSNSNSISGGTLSLGVAAEWTPRPIDKWLTAEQPTGTIDPTTASRYSLWAIPPKEAPVLELTSLLECFMKWDLNFHTASGINNNANGMIEGTLRYRRLSTRHGRRAEAPVLSMLTSENQLSRHFVEGDSEAPRALGKEGFEEMTAKHANSGYGYDPAGLSQAVNHLSTAIGSAGTQITTQGARLMRNSSHSTHKPGRHGLTQDDVVMMVSRCFNLKAEIEKKLAKGLERPPWNYNDPYQCITAALGMYMCVLDRHYRGDDLQAPSPDLNCALVLQKLQMLNCCIQGKRLREKGVLDLKEQQRHTPLAQTRDERKDVRSV
ncbi:hypothetical protein SARC_05536 [Sphaeroforma arctica JP610]|uniref:Uncharacterized protein n=1 Tax=Sphaeroforma arctica JP610 TaxID=667725 RepID=A0A0L0G1W0_9EUKA|nr:hypothetical protein SARC_05536 [Sphaeroforma arctica JP610]KNC82178.1 hypothetical protein SARC_05536 [Sphaeroforma arctica JP610]|eukprot:XP_014156080.1 hypothetical protein SARC_05536 [Sphaeroforma arctica JP610]